MNLQQMDLKSLGLWAWVYVKKNWNENGTIVGKGEIPRKEKKKKMFWDTWELC